jgi:DNA-binding response OmpR family regulator
VIETQHIPDFQTLSVLTELVTAIRNRSYSPVRAMPSRYVFGEIEIDEHMRIVRRAGEEVKLTPKEYELLVALARQQGAPISKQALMLEVWHTSAQTDSRTLDQHVFELRRKLEASKHEPRHLLTVRKFGYRLRSE